MIPGGPVKGNHEVGVTDQEGASGHHGADQGGPYGCLGADADAEVDGLGIGDDADDGPHHQVGHEDREVAADSLTSPTATYYDLEAPQGGSNYARG